MWDRKRGRLEKESFRRVHFLEILETSQGVEHEGEIGHCLEESGDSRGPFQRKQSVL